MEKNRRFSAENALKWKYSLKNITCCVFAVFLLLFRASGGRSGRFSAERSMRRHVTYKRELVLSGT